MQSRSDRGGGQFRLGRGFGLRERVRDMVRTDEPGQPQAAKRRRGCAE